MRVAGYLSISKSEKSLKMKIENKVYFVSLFDIVKILNGSRQWVPVLTMPNNDGNGKGNGETIEQKNVENVKNIVNETIIKKLLL